MEIKQKSFFSKKSKGFTLHLSWLIKIFNAKRWFKKGEGFTLAEILIVIGIIAFLSGIIVMVTARALEKARISRGLQFSASITHALGYYMIGEWKFENNLEDSSGNGNHGSWQSEEGKYEVNDDIPQLGMAGIFDGADYVELPSAISENIDSNITVEAWVYSDTLLDKSKYRAIITEKDTGDDNVEFSIYLDGKDHLFYAGFNDGGWYRVSEDETFPMNQWVQVAATYNGQTIRLFRNGIEVAKKKFILPQPLPPGTNGWRIGCRYNVVKSDSIWNGKIDEVRIYAETLTPAQIREHYVKGAKKRGLLTEK